MGTFGRSHVGRVAGMFSIAVVLSIYAGEWFVYHVVCEPLPHSAALFNTLLVLAVWSYLRTALTDPGTPESPEWQEWLLTRPTVHEEAGDDKATRQRGWAPGLTTWCDACSQPRPERAHHCSHCGVCILRMDHHCPWIGSCVGWRNHKFFLLLNWWSFWTALTFLATLRRPNVFEAFDLLGMLGVKMSMAPTIGVVSAFAFLLITGCMFAHALAMAMRNVTVVEDLFRGENPYCHESGMDNLKQLLGPLDWRLLLPLFPEGRPSGTSYEVAAKSPKVEEQGYLSNFSGEGPQYGSV